MYILEGWHARYISLTTQPEFDRFHEYLRSAKGYTNDDISYFKLNAPGSATIRCVREVDEFGNSVWKIPKTRMTWSAWAEITSPVAIAAAIFAYYSV